MEVLRWFFAALLCLMSFSSLATSSSESYIISQQNDDGSIYNENSIATSFQSTAEAAIALSNTSNEHDLIIAKAIENLDSDISSLSTEYLSKLIEVKLRLGLVTSDELAELDSRQSTDGGYSSMRGVESTVFDTAYALKIHGLTRQFTNKTNRAIGFLFNSQLANGGWAINDANPPSVEATSIVLEALYYHQTRINLIESLQNGVDFILSHLGKTYSNSVLSYSRALNALYPLTTDKSEYLELLEKLNGMQLSNGSWNNDTYLTALAHKANYLGTLQAETPSSYITGAVIDAKTGQVISDVSVSLMGPSSFSTTTSRDGSFVIEVSELGDYELEIKKNGFIRKKLSLPVTAMMDIQIGEISLVPYSTTDTQGFVLTGIVTSDSGTGLNGINVSISGPSNTSISTDINGSYSFNSNLTGDYVVSISAPGYHPTSVSFSTEPNNIYVYSPQLTLESFEEPTGNAVEGFVIDKNSQIAIESATLKLFNDFDSYQTTTDAEGRFSLIDTASGEYTLMAGKSGYKASAIRVVVPEKGAVNFGKVELFPGLSKSTLSGTVKAGNNGQPISGAIVYITSLGIEVSTDINGEFELTDITELNFTTAISADGYISQTTSFEFLEHQSATYGFVLQNPSDSPTGIQIISLAPDSETYGAYEKVTLKSVFASGSENKTLQMVIKLTHPSGEIETKPIVHNQIADDLSDSILTIPALKSGFAVDFEMMTEALSPGRYKIELQAYDSVNLHLLAVNQSEFRVLPKYDIESYKVVSSNPFVNQSSSIEISNLIRVASKSNVEFDASFEYTLIDPAGTVIDSGSSSASFIPSFKITDVEFTPSTIEFSLSGQYLLKVVTSINEQVVNESSTIIESIPLVNVIPEVTVTPQRVVPGKDKVIYIDLKLKGSNSQ